MTKWLAYNRDNPVCRRDKYLCVEISSSERTYCERDYLSGTHIGFLKRAIINYTKGRTVYTKPGNDKLLPLQFALNEDKREEEE